MLNHCKLIALSLSHTHTHTNVWTSHKFCNILVCANLQFNNISEAIWAIETTWYMVIGVLKYALLHFICDLKATQMNIQYSLILELMFYNFKLGHNVTEVTKNISCVKGESAVDQSNCKVAR